MQPPPSPDALGDPIYEIFYGFTEQPFAITTDPRFFYLSASHQRAYTELLNGLRRREGLLMITGETGTGKTTLCRAVLDALGDRTFSAIILNPYMTGAEVLRIILRDFGLVSHEELRRGGLATADVPQLLDTLESFLRSLVPLGSQAVLVLDEAQSLTPAVLDQVRVLTSLEDHGRRLLQVVLCGQPSLLETIKADALLALNERITRRVELTALPPEEIPGYIQHRLGVAGGSGVVRFDAAAMQAIADLSRGLPRRINVLCDRALQEGRIEGATTITGELVKRAARALAGVHDPLPVVPEPKPTPAAAPVPPPPPVAAPVSTRPTTADTPSSAGPASRVPPSARPAAATPATEPSAGSPAPAAPQVSGYGPATTHPPMPVGGTRPDLAAPPSDRVVSRAAEAPATRAATAADSQAETVRLPVAASPLARPPVPGPPAKSDIGDVTEVFRSEPDAPVSEPARPSASPASSAGADQPAAPVAPAGAAMPGTASGASAAPAATTVPSQPSTATRSVAAGVAATAAAAAAVARSGASAASASDASPSATGAKAAEAVATSAEPAAGMWSRPGAASPAESADRSDTSSTEVFTSFGVEKPREGALARRLALAAAVVVIVGAIGYVAWSWDVHDDGALSAAPVPPRPVLDRGTPLGPRPVPAPEEVDAIFRIRLRPWSPLRETPDDAVPVVDTPPEAAMPIAPLP